MSDPDVIYDSGNLAEDTGQIDEDCPLADMTATNEPTAAKMQFNVQMHGYTVSDFDEMLIQVAAEKLLSQTRDRDIKKETQDKAIELISERLDAHLSGVTKEIIDQPVLPRGFGFKDENPITMREYIGLIGRDYLTTKIKSDGTPATSSYDRGEPRVNRLIAEVLSKQFKSEMEKQTAELMRDFKGKLQSQFDEFIQGERDRIAKNLGYEIKKRR